MNIVEATGQPEFFFHVSAKKNLASIKKRGLVANMPGASPDGNYDGAWESLSGTYLTDDINLISHMIESRDDLSKFILVLIEGTADTLLPDEDIINIVAAEEWARLGSPEFDYDNEARNKAVITAIAMKLAQAATSKVTDLTRRVATNWWLIYEGGEGAAEENWTDLKDEFVKANPRLKRTQDRRAHSFRYPASIGFDGSPRIVAILVADQSYLVLKSGSVPQAAMSAINDLATTMGIEFTTALPRAVRPSSVTKAPTASASFTPKQEELLALALRCFPWRSQTEIEELIRQMDATKVEQQIAQAKERLASDSPSPV